MSLLPSKSLEVRPMSGLNRRRPDHLEGFRVETPKSEDAFLRKALQPVSSKAREILQRSALHGFPSIFSKDTIWLLKLMWIGCIALSWGYFGYQAYNTLNLYQSFPKVTLISKASETYVDFPGKICFFFSTEL